MFATDDPRYQRYLQMKDLAGQGMYVRATDVDAPVEIRVLAVYELLTGADHDGALQLVSPNLVPDLCSLITELLSQQAAPTA